MSGTRVVLEGRGKFDYNASDVRAEWKRWKRGFNSWLIGSEQDTKKEVVKVNLFLTLMGSEGQDICETFEFTEEQPSLTQVLEQFDSHFAGLSNVTMARFRFFSCMQGDASVTDFVTSLKSLANDCEFGDLRDSLVKDMMMVINGSSEKLRERLLKEPKLDLVKAVEISRIDEDAARNVNTIGRSADGGSAGALVAGKRGSRRSGTPFSRSRTFDGDCFECGEYGHKAMYCPRRKSDGERGRQRQSSGDSDGNHDGNRKTYAGYAAGWALGASTNGESRGQWFVDSGASQHMTWDRSCFDWYEPYQQPRKVTLGDGTTVFARGQGEVKLKVRAAAGVALVSISQVQFVPKLQMSLFSVPVTTKRGNRVAFRRDACIVSCGSLRLRCPLNGYELYEVPILRHGGDQLGPGQLGTTGGCPTPGGVTGKSEYRSNLKGHGRDQWKAGSPDSRTMDGWKPRFQDSRIETGGQGYPGASTRSGTKAGGQGYPGASSRIGIR